MREPGIIAWPGTIKAGRVSAAVAHTTDIFATALALAGVAPPAGLAIDGRDLRQVTCLGSHSAAHPRCNARCSGTLRWPGRSSASHLLATLRCARCQQVMLNESAPSPHECVYMWKGTRGLGCPQGHGDCPGLWAVRCGAHNSIA